MMRKSIFQGVWMLTSIIALIASSLAMTQFLINGANGVINYEVAAVMYSVSLFAAMSAGFSANL